MEMSAELEAWGEGECLGVEVGEPRRVKRKLRREAGRQC
jgi:hypothetical protein